MLPNVPWKSCCHLPVLLPLQNGHSFDLRRGRDGMKSEDVEPRIFEKLFDFFGYGTLKLG